MYPDPITPRAFPEILSRLDYDPFQVMPGGFPGAPRVFTTTAQIERAKQRIQEGIPADTEGIKQLLTACRLEEPLPAYKDEGGPPDWGGPLLPWLNLAFRNALAAHLTGDDRHRQRALEAMRLAAGASEKISRWTGHEHNEAIAAARAYDLLAASPLNPDDDNALRGMLWQFHHGLDYLDHRACNNHNVMNATGRLSIAIALGHRQWIHDAFHGYLSQGKWRYGLIHTLRHDFLADGMQWEGTVGYHQLVLGLVCECFRMMERCGVNLWLREWPQSMKDEGFDEHRGWGPKGRKSLTAAFDALLYQAFSNGDYSRLHDSGEKNLSETSCWWAIFNTAWEVYGEARYAWALKQINGGKAARADQPPPPWLSGHHAGLEFVRIEPRDYPDGESPFTVDRNFSLAGRHIAGCSLFPVHGAAILRADPADREAPGIHLYWGRHWSGHRSPAALHLDIHAFGRLLTNTPFVSLGYRDSRHLTWNRTTIAHNTVTVDETPMFPYDAEGDSIWEYDLWRDSISDGVLEAFQATPAFSAVRVSNDNVYPDVRLERSVLLTRDYLVDVYRVAADRERKLDWALHGSADLAFEVGKGEPVDLGARRGYQHLSRAVRQETGTEWTVLPYRAGEAGGQVLLWMRGAPEMSLILATDPVPEGNDLPAQPSTLMLRTCAAAATFAAIWSFDARQPLTAAIRQNDPEALRIDIASPSGRHSWRLPAAGEIQALHS